MDTDSFSLNFEKNYLNTDLNFFPKKYYRLDFANSELFPVLCDIKTDGDIG